MKAARAMDFALAILIAVVLVLSFVWPMPRPELRADEPAQQNTTPDRKAIQGLIAQLRSSNKDPNPNMDPFVWYPPGYDESAQEKVEAARQRLIALKTAAFPILIEHLGDSEYSRSIHTAVLRGLSVGDACFEIIESQVDLSEDRYKWRDGADGKEHVHRRYFATRYCNGAWYSKDGIRKWWTEHERHSLKDMQIEALEWTIKREKVIGFPSDQDRKRFLKPLEEKLAEINRK
jgi:hypothetical protein